MSYNNVEYINLSVFCECSYVYLDPVKGGGFRTHSNGGRLTKNSAT